MVMATGNPSKPVGHECEFVDQVPEDYFCKQCSHVTREPTIASCCTEVFCKACIEAVIEDKKPCPNCQETDINYIPYKKYQPKILALKVHCSLKNRGCEWTGQLQHLDAHLDLTTGDCVYVDVDCPSKCSQKVQKRNVDTHLANHCPNRDYTCPHCSFKATFREVSEHFKVCRYYPLVCPNRCGASFERDVLEDHMKICGQQKVQCEFSYAGCGAEFIRDHQKEHMEQNSQKHLALVAAATLRISQTFEQKFQEQQREFKQKLEDKDSEIKAIVNKTSQLVNEQRRQSDVQMRDLEVKLEQRFELRLAEKDALTQKTLEQQQRASEEKMEEQWQAFEQRALEQLQMITEVLEQQKVFEEKLGEQREEFHKQQRMLEEKVEEKDQQIETLESHHGSAINSLRMEVGILPYEFTLADYQERKAKGSPYFTPHMCTHPGGYKFKLDVYVYDTRIAVWGYLGKSDYHKMLKFPARFTITLELLNQHRDQDHYRRDIQFELAKESLGGCVDIGYTTFISNPELADKESQYLQNDCLRFRLTKVDFI